MCSPTGRDRGSLSAFVAGVAACLALVAGMVVDTGRCVEEHARIAGVAASAARIGAQSVTGIREGDPRVDRGLARRRAEEFLAANGARGTVVTEGLGVRVTVSVKVPMRTLVLVGVGSRTVTVTRSASVVDG